MCAIAAAFLRPAVPRSQRAGCSAAGPPSFSGTYSSRRHAARATTAHSSATTATFLLITVRPPPNASYGAYFAEAVRLPKSWVKAGDPNLLITQKCHVTLAIRTARFFAPLRRVSRPTCSACAGKRVECLRSCSARVRTGTHDRCRRRDNRDRRRGGRSCMTARPGSHDLR